MGAEVISLILPYWDRQEVADKAFALLDQQYYGMELEIIVVDDGNAVPFRVPPHMPNVRVVTLPRKDEPKSPVTCWNEGVKAARGDIVVLSCVEILHTEPVLQQMADEVRRLGPKGYVLAAAWCPELNEWHCHSSVDPPHNAPGTGIAFCAALHKSLYWEAGGFDEEYRDGAGYEDCDFINRLLVAGANFVKRDDLVVIHPKSGAHIKWRPEAFERNRALYAAKWVKRPQGPFVNFVCVKAGTAFGPEYVNILFDMVRRNLPNGYPGRFTCITDDGRGLDPMIHVEQLPADLERWWGKLYMFKRGLFPDGARCVFMDLDTVIVGKLDRLAAYRGQFATLRDFYHRRLGPAVIAWEAGEFAASIWEEWVSQGKPRHEMGDLWWLNQLDQGRFPKTIDILQDLFPGDFVSYKKDCAGLPPKGAKVVCFHGNPRPHQARDEWVQKCWKVGGGTAAEMSALCNTEREKVAANIRSALARGLPEIGEADAHDGHAVLVGGGPSLKNSLGEIRWRAGLGQKVFALNGAARYLHEQGIRVDCQVILDARPANAQFILDKPCFLASHCDPSVFDAAGANATVYHVNTEGIVEAMNGRQADLISTGSTVGMIAMGIAYFLGYRNLHLFGYDSSYTDEHHAYPQPLNDDDAVIEAEAGGRKFRCAPWMVLQAQQFQALVPQLTEQDCVITVAGDGLLPNIARLMGNQLEVA